MLRLEPNKRYIVTKASDDGTFEVGDHITLYVDGTLACFEAMGWIDANDVPAATQGMEVEVDKEWASKALSALDRFKIELSWRNNYDRSNKHTGPSLR